MIVTKVEYMMEYCGLVICDLWKVTRNDATEVLEEYPIRRMIPHLSREESQAPEIGAEPIVPPNLLFLRSHKLTFLEINGD